MIASHKATIFTSAHRGLCKPKKTIDHNALRISWSPKTDRAFRTSGWVNPFFQIRKAAMPMSAYRIVQTGPNIQLGGLRAGLASVIYQVGIADAVKNVPIIPASSQMIIEKIHLRVLFIVD